MVKKLLIIIATLLLTVNGWSATTYFKNLPNGGSANALDSVDGTGLSDGDRAIIVKASGGTIVYTLDADSGLSEDSTYLRVIAPDTNAGTKRWHKTEDGGRVILGDGTIDQGDANIVGTLAWHKADASTTPTTITTPSGTFLLSTAVTLGSTFNLKFDKGGVYKPAVGVSLTVYSPENIDAAPNQQIIDISNNAVNPLVFTKSGTTYIEWFGGKADDSTDNTAFFTVAQATHISPIIQLLSGIYLHKGIEADARLVLKGQGVAGSTYYRTTLENTHATNTGIRMAHGWSEIRDIKIDNGTNAGSALWVSGSYSNIENLWIVGQGGTDYAFKLVDATLSNIQNIGFSDGNYSNLYVYKSYYSTFTHISGGSPTSGVGAYFEQADGVSVSGMYMEAGLLGMLTLKTCYGITFYNLTTEVGAVNITGNAYITIDDTYSAHFYGGRFSQSNQGTDVEAAIFELKETAGATQGIVIDGFAFLSGDTTDTTEKILISDAVENVKISNIRNYPSVVGSASIKCDATVTQMVIENWYDVIKASTHTIDATSLVISNTNTNIALTSRANQTLINCSGTLSGTGLASAVIIDDGKISAPKLYPISGYGWLGAGNQVITAAGLLTGVVVGDPEGNANWTLDTAANIVAAIDNPIVGMIFRVLFISLATVASGETITILAGSGIDLYGQTVTLTEGTNENIEIVFRIYAIGAGSEAIAAYILAGA